MNSIDYFIFNPIFLIPFLFAPLLLIATSALSFFASSMFSVVGFSQAIASASTVNLYSAVGDTVAITGTATITSFGTSATSGAYRKLIFSSSGAILTYNASTLVLLKQQKAIARLVVL